MKANAKVGLILIGDELMNGSRQDKHMAKAIEILKQRGLPLAWVRIHDLPDFVVFDHRPHVSAGVACQKCHGPVETMEKMRQFRSLSMGWCVNCHRDPHEAGIVQADLQASIDCSACHH